MRRFTIVVLSLLGARLAAADEPKFEYGKHDDVKDVKAPEWFATAEAGLVLTTGNSETTSASGAFKASRKAGDNKLSLEASGAYSKSGVLVLNDLNGNGVIDSTDELTTQETVTAETLYGKARYDRFLTDFNSAYIAAIGSRDLPAGKLSVFGGQAGYSRRLYKSKTAETVGEFGFDYSREHLVGGDAVSVDSLRVFVGHKAAMTPGTDLDTSLELLTNVNHETLPTHQDGSAFEDTRINGKLAVSSKVAGNLAFQMSFEFHFDNRPGPLALKNLAMGFVPAAQPLDTLMKASLIYTFAAAPPAPPKPPVCTPAPAPAPATPPPPAPAAPPAASP